MGLILNFAIVFFSAALFVYLYGMDLQTVAEAFLIRTFCISVLLVGLFAYFIDCSSLAITQKETS